MGKLCKDNQVKPIRFQSIPEDGANRKQNGEASKTFDSELESVLKRYRQQDNFSFEYSYPAVMFEKICFSIDKSKQQANPINKYYFKLKSCVGSLAGADNDRNKIEILKSVNLSVPYGSIFGLLGPSSCGKTTLLRCLVGLIKPSSGCIRLFCDNYQAYGNKSGKFKYRDKGLNNCKVPGINVGYMPQDLGLYEDFTIRQLLTMFGQYVEMEPKLIESRIVFMSKFLDLPEVNREISTLSGGQKRRVSFAIACLHMPPLIILDEPTVGVDPLLRKSIWKYLRRLADEERKTIIITTHYIEEAAQADQVALMRAGEILIQDTPARIMDQNGCKTLEEAFLKICNNVQHNGQTQCQRYKLYPQPRFDWHDKLKTDEKFVTKSSRADFQDSDKDLIVRELKMKLQKRYSQVSASSCGDENDVQNCQQHNVKLEEKINKLSMAPNIMETMSMKQQMNNRDSINQQLQSRERKNNKYVVNNSPDTKHQGIQESKNKNRTSKKSFFQRIKRCIVLTWALLYKNYRRNVNSLPLVAFQFILPIAQMIIFSLCVGGRPTDIGLGLVNHDQPTITSPELMSHDNNTSLIVSDTQVGEELMSSKYLSFIDHSMISIRNYDTLKDALNDVRKAKLWAAMEIGENFTTTILRRFDLDNFYQLDMNTIQQSVIKLYPDRSNKVLDMICHRSLVNSYRQFLLDQFDHFKQLPVEIREPIFDIKPNLISNSIDGYTESIAAGLLASLTYIMAAGLTCFIMVVERSDGILERTFTSGINPVAYLLAHAVFRSFVMMLQVGLVMYLTFFILQQPLVGSIWLAYLMLMTINLTGIAYGMVISSLVTDQNGAALTIVSSLVVKITMSGILWPFEAIPYWLRAICYVQPLTMPVKALKTITLKGRGIEDKSVFLGFLVSLIWLLVFIIISAKRFKFYQY